MLTETHRNRLTCVTLASLLCLILLLAGCLPASSPLPIPPMADAAPPAKLAVTPSAGLHNMGYSIQVGAFADPDNAARLEQTLAANGLDAYAFRHESGLYKVRFGNYASSPQAVAEAGRLQAQGVIDTPFVVPPEAYPAARIETSGKGDLRTELVETARRFLGTPYRWESASAEDGFDCSGLTMVCYRLNGLDLPRVSRDQFKVGRPVSMAQLAPGDLVFFATRGGNRVNHVGIYIGDGQFIHAPRPGQNVRIEKLANRFFASTYIGGRSYL